MPFSQLWFIRKMKKKLCLSFKYYDVILSMDISWFFPSVIVVSFVINFWTISKVVSGVIYLFTKGCFFYEGIFYDDSVVRNSCVVVCRADKCSIAVWFCGRSADGFLMVNLCSVLKLLDVDWNHWLVCTYSPSKSSFLVTIYVLFYFYNYICKDDIMTFANNIAPGCPCCSRFHFNVKVFSKINKVRWNQFFLHYH